MTEKKSPATPKSKQRLVACPTCQTMTEYSPQNAYRPFCSERCKLIDLGEWANEGYRIPDKTPIDQTEEPN